MEIIKSHSGQLTLMVTADSHLKAIYSRALTHRWYGQLACSYAEADRLLKVNHPYIIFIDQSLPEHQAEKLVDRIQYDYSPLVIVYLADQVTGDLALRLWGKVKELLPKPVTESTIQTICEKYCLSSETSSSVWRVASQVISQNYSDPQLSEREIAKELGLTPPYFSRLFKLRTGKSFQQTLNDSRINMAQQLLIETNQQVKEIAHRVGYNRSDSFIKTFQKITGESPSLFRQRIRVNSNHK